MNIEELAQDFRYALHTLRKAPGYAGLVVATLAFGIAANTTVFSVMNPYLFRPLPFGEPDALVQLGQVDPVNGWDMDRFSLPIYEDWKARTRAFSGLAAYTYSGANVTGSEGPEVVGAGWLTDDMFDVLEVDAELGRVFGPGEGGPSGSPVVVLSRGLWERRYGADPSVLGRTMVVDGEPHTIIGVMPAAFSFPFGGVKMWLPVREDPASAPRGSTPYLLVGRLGSGWDAGRADAELTAIQSELAARYPDADGKWEGVSVEPLRKALNFAWDVLAVSFAVLLGAVVFVLAIACFNVASLTLVRASDRAREVSVRRALGAPRGRIVRQLLTESGVLAVLGGGLGIALTYWIARLIGPVIPEDLYRIGEVSVDGTVLAFSTVLTLTTPLLFGLAPALGATGLSLTEGLKEGTRSSGGVGSTRGRRVLVSAQIALAVVLLTGAGLMLRSLTAVQRLELGFDSGRLLAVGLTLAESGYRGDEDLRQYVDGAVAELRAVPGVTSVAASLYIPLNHETSLWQFAPPEQSGVPGEEWPTAIANRPYPGYFATMGIPVLAGRDFAPEDDVSGAPVVIVNQALADRSWPGASAVGRTLLVGDPDAPMTATVVGVVGDVVHEGLDVDVRQPQVYRPALQDSFRRHFLLVRTEGPPVESIQAVRTVLLALEPDVPVAVRTMDSVVSESLLQWSIGTGFLGVFGGGALLLATLGIYGLVSYTVSQRRREVGVRAALGATRGEIGRAVLADGVRLTLVGLGVGLIAAVAVGRLMAAILYEVSPNDPVTLAGVLALFALVAAAASLVPAARASRTDPIEALRGD